MIPPDFSIDLAVTLAISAIVFLLLMIDPTVAFLWLFATAIYSTSQKA